MNFNLVRRDPKKVFTSVLSGTVYNVDIFETDLLRLIGCRDKQLCFLKHIILGVVNINSEVFPDKNTTI